VAQTFLAVMRLVGQVKRPPRSCQIAHSNAHSYLAQARHQVLPVIAALLPLGKKRLRESYRLTGVR
jgi:hypothetical protein